MRETRVTRRGVLRGGSGLAGLLAAGGLSGCSLLEGDSLPERSDPAVLEDAPARTVAATHLDVEGLLADESLRAAIDDQLAFLHERSERVPPDTTTALERLAERIRLDPTALESVFGVVVRPESADRAAGDDLDPLATTDQAALVRAGWAMSDIRTAMAAGAETVETASYRDAELLSARTGADVDLTVGRREPGVFAVGERAGVEALLDVGAGGASARDTRLAAAFGAARPGPARLAVAPRDGGDRVSGFGDPVALLAGKIDVAYGSLYAEGDRRGVELRLETGSGFDAEDVHESAGSVLALARSGQLRPEFEPVLRQAEAMRNGSTVTLRYDAGLDGFATTMLSVAAATLLPTLQ